MLKLKWQKKMRSILDDEQCDKYEANQNKTRAKGKARTGSRKKQ